MVEISGYQGCRTADYSQNISDKNDKTVDVQTTSGGVSFEEISQNAARDANIARTVDSSGNNPGTAIEIPADLSKADSKDNVVRVADIEDSVPSTVQTPVEIPSQNKDEIEPEIYIARPDEPLPYATTEAASVGMTLPTNADTTTATDKEYIARTDTTSAQPTGISVPSTETVNNTSRGPNIARTGDEPTTSNQTAVVEQAKDNSSKNISIVRTKETINTGAATETFSITALSLNSLRNSALSAYQTNALMKIFGN